MSEDGKSKEVDPKDFPAEARDYGEMLEPSLEYPLEYVIDFESTEEPSITDFRSQLRVLRESILALYWGTQEIEDPEERLTLRKSVASTICMTLVHVDLFITRHHGRAGFEDLTAVLPFCLGDVGAIDLPLSLKGAYITLKWPVNGTREVVDCFIPKKYWRSNLRWKRLNTRSQPREFRYPDG